MYTQAVHRAEALRPWSVVRGALAEALVLRAGSWPLAPATLIEFSSWFTRRCLSRVFLLRAVKPF